MLVITRSRSVQEAGMLQTLVASADPVTQSFIAHTSQVTEVRRFIAEHVPDPAVLADLLVLTSEVATNAIRHGRPFSDGTITVAVAWDGVTATVAVTDAGSLVSTPHVKPSPGGDGEGGRGLWLVNAMASEWGYTRGRGSATIWFSLSAA
jgi:anti-sigma regulatory factor (Ser/Thr protein kinase)